MGKVIDLPKSAEQLARDKYAQSTATFNTRVRAAQLARIVKMCVTAAALGLLAWLLVGCGP